MMVSGVSAGFMGSKYTRLLKQGEAGHTVAIVEVSWIESPCGSSSRCIRLRTPPYFGVSARASEVKPSASPTASIPNLQQRLFMSASPPRVSERIRDRREIQSHIPVVARESFARVPFARAMLAANILLQGEKTDDHRAAPSDSAWRARARLHVAGREPRRHGVARGFPRQESRPRRPLSRAPLPVLPPPDRPAQRDAGQAEEPGRGNHGGGQYAPGTGTSLLQVPPRPRAAGGGSRGDRAASLPRARDRGRRGPGRLLELASPRHHAAGGGGSRQPDRRVAGTHADLRGHGDAERQGRLRGHRGRQADRGRAWHEGSWPLPHR